MWGKKSGSFISAGGQNSDGKLDNFLMTRLYDSLVKGNRCFESFDSPTPRAKIVIHSLCDRPGPLLAAELSGFCHS